MGKKLIILSCLILLFGIGIYHNIFDASGSESIKPNDLAETINSNTTFSMLTQSNDLEQKEHSQELLSNSAPNYIKNYGQIPDNNLKFYTGIGGAVNTYFTTDGIYYVYDNEIIQIDIVGGNFENPIGKEITPEIIIYETNDFSQSNIETYRKVLYSEIYPGISLEIESLADGDKITYILKPKSDHTQIKTRLSNEQLSFLGMTETGNLKYELNGNSIIEEAPVCYQFNNEIKEYIDCSYKITSGNYIRYDVDTYDSDKVLFIDPVKKWSLVVGSDYDIGEKAHGVATDDDGYIYMTGYTNDVFGFCNSTNRTSEGITYSSDVFVVKFDETGQRKWTHIIGSSSTDIGQGITTYNNDIFLTGYTYSTASFGNSQNKTTEGVTGSPDVFVVKLNSSGNREWTFIGASEKADYGKDIAVDNYGIHVTGWTDYRANFCNSSNKYTEGGVSTYSEVFVIKLNQAGQRQWTFIAGSGNYFDYGYSITVLGGNSYVAGRTTSGSTFAGSTNKRLGGDVSTGNCAFVMKLNSAGTRQWTYLTRGEAYGIAVDSSGYSYVTGISIDGSDFAGGITRSEGTIGGIDIFLLKLSSTGYKQWATVIGSASSISEYGHDICLDSSKNSYITGKANDGSSLGSSSSRYIEGASGGSKDTFVMKFSSSGVRQWTFVGRSGYGSSSGEGIAIYNDSVYAAGYTPNGTGFANPTNKIIEGTAKSDDAYLMKLNTNGQRQWTFIAASGIGNSDIGYSIAMDNDENVYLTGDTAVSTRYGNDSNKYIAGTPDSTDVFVMKINKLGQRQWTYIAGSSDSKSDNGKGIGIDSNGDLYVTGMSYDGINFAGASNRYTEGTLKYNDVFIIKLNNSGQREWTFIAGGGNNNDYSYGGIAVDIIGNSYITGMTYEGINFAGSSNRYTEGTIHSSDVFVMKLNTSGKRQWTYIAGSSTSKADSGYRVAVDSNGFSYITGKTNDGGNFADSLNRYTEGSLNKDDVFIIALNNSGQRQWTNIIGSGANDVGFDIEVDASSNTYITGYTASSPGFGGSENRFYEGSLRSLDDVFVMKLNKTGFRQWTFIGSSSSSKYERGNDIALDSNSNSYITGYTSDSVNFANSNNKFSEGTLDSTDAFVIKLNSSGKREWTYFAGGANYSSEYGQGIAVDSTGNSIYLTGKCNAGTNFAGSSDTEGTLSGYDAFVMKLEDIQGISPPICTNFDGGTTNFSEEGNLSNVTNLTIELTGKGKIKFGQYGIKTDGTDFNTHIKIENSVISINTSALGPTFNNSATLTFENVNCNTPYVYYSETKTTRSAILLENNLCLAPRCTNIQCADSTLTVNVTHFSGYAVNGTANLTIDADDPRIVLELVTFTAEYRNATGLIEGATCTISLPDGDHAMNELASHIYNYSTTFATAQTVDYNVTCNKTEESTVFANDTATINAADIPEFSIITLTFGLIAILAGLFIIRRKT